MPENLIMLRKFRKFASTSMILQKPVLLTFTPKPGAVDNGPQIHSQHRGDEHQGRALLEIAGFLDFRAGRGQNINMIRQSHDRLHDGPGKQGGKISAAVNMMAAVSPAAPIRISVVLIAQPKRPHKGKRCQGKTPFNTFIENLPLAKEKMLDKEKDKLPVAA